MPITGVRFRATDGVTLEGRLAMPDQPSGGAVLCHPHPQMQGSMSSALIPAIQRALEPRGWAALRFNFRGVGRSEGRYEGGLGERRDVAGALAFLTEETGVSRLAVAGWSFGALVGLAAAVADDRVGTYVAIAPPVSVRAELDVPPLPPKELLGRWRGRALALCGTEDSFCSPEALERWAGNIPGARVQVFAGQDHLFSTGRETVAEAVAAFVTEG